MNNWANDQNRNDQDWNRLLNQDWNPDLINQPPNIEVRDSSVYRNGWKVANLVQTDSTDPEDFKEVHETLQAHFKVRHPSPAPRPAAVPDVPDDSVVNLLPDDPDLFGDDEAFTANEFAAGFEIPDTNKRRIERCEYLNKLLSRKLDLDFEIAWKEFNLRGDELAYQPSPFYEDLVFETLKKACDKIYDHYCLESEYFRLNEHLPIELDIDIDWTTTFFHELGFDWWFDIRNHSLI